jgi:RimJ/RimL family protein N-acetyltransferase
MMAGKEPPVGAPIDWKGAKAPERVVHQGRYVRLEPVDAERHAVDLYQRSKDQPLLWTYLGYGPFADQASFTAWLAERAKETDPLFFAVIDLASGRASGVVSYLRITPAQGVIEIGHIWFTPVLQRSRQATEAIYLMARQVFEVWGYRRLEWKCDSLNAPSRRAAARFGFAFEGVFLQHLIVKGRNRDTAWFAMLDREWPEIRAGFERWLEPGNFDAGGTQKRSLQAAGVPTAKPRA